MLLIAAMFANGITPSYIISAPGVASGMGAKLLCSARYVSGFSQQQAFADLVQYSAILDRLDVEYNEEARTVSTSLFGFAPTTATYVEGLGCANGSASSCRVSSAHRRLQGQEDASARCMFAH
jgi:hypothetical protein